MEISINCHSSIRIDDGKIIYFDPFKIEDETHDADIIFITHDHHDHFSIDDIKKIEKDDTVYVVPESMYNLLGGENVITVKPYEKVLVEDYEVYVVPSYNANSSFHPKEKAYVGYVVTIGGKRVYVAGDCDLNDDNKKIKCDIALLPIGGKYTMDYTQAAQLANIINPEVVIPTHYGDIIGSKQDVVNFKELINNNIIVDVKIERDDE